MGENVGGDQASPADNPANTKIWEQALTTSEIRKHAAHWSLGGDGGLLKHMQDFATRLTTRAHAVHCEVSQLTYDTRLMDTKIQCVTDYFLTLSDRQFIENRVYDEDVSIKNEENEDNNENKPKTKEEKEKELISKLKAAVDFGLNVMEDCFDVLDIKAGDSDLSEDEDGDDLDNEVILEAKDVYVNRPLPYLIGSRDFYEDDNVGVGDIPSSDEMESDADSLSESEDEVEKANTVSDLSSTDYSTSDGEESGNERENIKQRKSLSSDMSSDEDEEASENKTLSDSYSSDESVKVEKKKPVKKKKRTRSRKSTQDNGDMFFGGQEDQNDLFASSGGLFGSHNKLFDAPKKGGGLFDDLSDKSDLGANSEISEEEEEEEKVVEIPQKKKPVKKLPQGGVNLFGGAIKKGFFNEEKSESDSEEEFDAKPALPSQSKGLFDDSDEDEEDLFGSENQPSKTAKPTQSHDKSKKGGLFNDVSSDSDEGNLFGTQSKPQVEDSKDAPKSQKPVGGVSMFSAGGNKLQTDLKKRIQNSSSSEKSEAVNTKSGNSDKSSKSSTVQSKKTSSLFSESSDDENLLFHAKTSSIKSNKTPVSNFSINKTGKQSSLFGDSDSSSDNDLFGSNKSASGSIASFTSKSDAQKRNQTGNKLNLSDSDPDPLFSTLKPMESFKNSGPTKNSPPKNSEKVKTSNLFGESSDSDDLFSSKPRKKKDGLASKSSNIKPNNLFDSGSEDDLFGSKTISKKKHMNGNSDSKKVNKVQLTPKVTKVQSTGLFGSDSDSDDDDDLFSNKESKPAVKPKAKQPEKKEEIQSEELSSAVKKVGLFDESSDENDDSEFFSQQRETIKKEKRLQKVENLFESDSNAEKEEPKSEEEDFTEEVEELPKRKVLPGAVSMFGVGGGELLAAISKRRSASQKSSSSTKSNESDILSPDVDDSKLKQNQSSDPLQPEKLTPKPGVNQMESKTPDLDHMQEKTLVLNKEKTNAPDLNQRKQDTPDMSQTKSKVPDLDQAKADLNMSSSTNIMANPFTPVLKEKEPPSVTKVAAPKFNAKSIGKLQSKITINPNAMLPGAVPTIKSSRDPNQPLDTTTKSRSKGQGGRRPPTRKGRRNIAAQSYLGADFENSSSVTVVSVAQRSETKTTKAVEEKPEVTKKSGQLSDDVDSFFDDLTAFSKKDNKPRNSEVENKFESSAEEKALKLTMEKSANAKSSKITDSFSDDDDLFSSVKTSKSKPKKVKKVDDLFTNILENDEEDFFFSPPPKKDLVDLDDMFSEKSAPLLDDKKSSSKIKKHSMFNDDLFGDLDDDILTTKSTKKIGKEESKKKIMDSFGDLDFGITKKKDEKKGKSDDFDDLFGDEDGDDLFLVESLKSKTKSKKNLPKTKNLFLEDDDDIFSSETLKSTSKKTNSSDKKTKEEKEQDIFDDPLNALLS